MHSRPIRKLLIANRGEIAIRICRAASELGMTTVAIYSHEDRFALHRFKADQGFLVGQGKGPVEAYLDIDGILAIAREAKVDAIHPGYGFLSENPDFADACRAAGIVFVGPSGEVMRRLGNKVAARQLAQSVAVPVMPATPPLPDDHDEMHRLAQIVGYPVMLKASWGGGGRGMRVVESADDLDELAAAARREAKAAFGNDEIYLEKLVRHARHVEVQILGDQHGNLVHLYERDCSVQRRNQKVVERAPAPYLDDSRRQEICALALRIGQAVGYANAGTVEFLMDAETDAFYFIEVNPRIQVEHTVTEEVTGIDIVKAQLRIAAGERIGTAESGVPDQDKIRLDGHALQCRVTTEDAANNFVPDYGRIIAYRGATGFGLRLDGGTAFSGALVTRHYDSLLEKVTAWGNTPDEAALRMLRALREFRIRGVATNLAFLESVVSHPSFRAALCTTRFIDDTPDLFRMRHRRDRASRLLSFIGDVIVNQNPEVKGRPAPQPARLVPPMAVAPAPAPLGTRSILQQRGAQGVADWMRAQTRLLITDTSMRDGHQSLLATRFRTADLVGAAPAYRAWLPHLFSVECWGGATFDVAMRFLKECPWERLEKLRTQMDNHLLQMLLRASNAVGYTNYADNVVRRFVARAAETGIDVFRVFDSLNWVENMRLAMDAVIESGKICEGTICYTGNILDPDRAKYDLAYYVRMAKQLEAAGAHILGLKDMAGILTPAAAKKLISALKQEVGLPIHLHTHDTSGIAAATLLAAAEAGVDAVDAAMDSLSGTSSQPCLGSLVAALRHTERDTGLDGDSIRRVSQYWEAVRHNYRAFEAETKSGTSDVYNHEMPGGQYTNLRQQARSMGIEHRWPEVARAYAQVNRLFGDVVKVTPSSKVVGDMALVMVTGNLSADDVLNPDRDVAFPESVVSFFKGELGQPEGGFPPALQRKILGDSQPLTVRPGAVLPPVDLEAERLSAESAVGRAITDNELCSWLMYPKVFTEYALFRRRFGFVSVLPTPTFFYGMAPGEEIAVDLEPGKTLYIRCLAVGEPDESGSREIYFELNGQPRTVRITDTSLAPRKQARPRVEDGNVRHVGAPMPGLISGVLVSPGQQVSRGERLFILEAMKMETTVAAERDGVIERVEVVPGTQVETKELLAVFA